ncbi:hypothetical protein F383_39325 [Gossypium arboreum]|uniref:Uncharacterized protein n=1 Tax=Gossypium arboreum TaxID=29729 RepID=A0A0B0MR20_GOSAR|nr:hypothetical protein F383_39325 [Gossypium arboreum]
MNLTHSNRSILSSLMVNLAFEQHINVCIYSMEIKCCKVPAFKIIYGQH